MKTAKDHGVPSPTYVVQLYNAPAPSDVEGMEQKACCYQGIGTDGTWWDKALGGSTGNGRYGRLAWHSR
ncbi:DUF2235 domain-containing protein [Rhizobium mongolense]|uniref:DUF2235 domain-containing protein n=1 Tax=Rhizobium mongolense TaxID=57676 RepID=UPI0011140C0F|nr:DUF2235 domain-containing protein [Rhizobium mongolense]